MKKFKRNGFTLVELLAVIVILAVILVIAVPQILHTIDSARLGAFKSTAKLLLTQAEKQYLVDQTLKVNGGSIETVTYEGTGSGNTECGTLAKLGSDYTDCKITVDGSSGIAVLEVLTGAGKFANYSCTNSTLAGDNSAEISCIKSENNSSNQGTNTPLEPAILSCTNKTYNGSEQTACTCVGGTLGGDYKATNAGSYTASCVGDENHSNPEDKTWEISKVAATISCTNKTYNGSEQTACTCSGGTLSGEYKATNAGSHIASCTGDLNHSDATNVTWTMNKRTVSVTAPAVVSSTLTYNGSAQNLVLSVGNCSTGGTMYWYNSNPTTSNSTPSFSTSSGWTTTRPTNYKGTNAGTYYIYYYCLVSDTANNSGSAINSVRGVSKIINAASSSSDDDWIYLGSEAHCGNECANDCRHEYGNLAKNGVCSPSPTTPPTSSTNSGQYCWCKKA